MPVCVWVSVKGRQLIENCGASYAETLTRTLLLLLLGSWECEKVSPGGEGKINKDANSRHHLIVVVLGVKITIVIVLRLEKKLCRRAGLYDGRRKMA